MVRQLPVLVLALVLLGQLPLVAASAGVVDSEAVDTPEPVTDNGTNVSASTEDDDSTAPVNEANSSLDGDSALDADSVFDDDTTTREADADSDRGLSITGEQTAVDAEFEENVTVGPDTAAESGNAETTVTLDGGNASTTVDAELEGEMPVHSFSVGTTLVSDGDPTSLVGAVEPAVLGRASAAGTVEYDDRSGTVDEGPGRADSSTSTAAEVDAPAFTGTATGADGNMPIETEGSPGSDERPASTDPTPAEQIVLVAGFSAVGLVSTRVFGPEKLSVARTFARLQNFPTAGQFREWGIRLFGLCGVHDHEDPLDNETRATVYDHLVRSPGTYLSEISDATSLPLGTVRYHLKVLRAEGYVTRTEVRGRQRYVPVGEELSELDAALAEEVSEAVLRELARGGPDSVSGLADRLDRDPSTVSYHLDKLESAGLVERERTGQAVENGLTPIAAARLVDHPVVSAEDTVPGAN